MEQITPDFSKSLRLPITNVKQMLTVQRDGNQTLVKINSSSLSIIQTCMRKSFYLLNEKWQARTGSPPLIFGSGIHKALEVFYNQPRGDRSIPADFEEHAAMIPHGFDPSAPHYLYDAVRAFVTETSPLQALPDTDKRSCASGIWTLGHYFRTYQTDIYEIYRDEAGAFTERTFSVPLVESAKLKIELFGTIDFILRNTATGELLPGDHKTSSQMGGDFLNRIKPNHQYTGYLFGARQAYGIDADNFLVNGIQVKPKPTTARGGPPTFTRQITRRTEADFTDFKEVVTWYVEAYLLALETGRWPLGNVDACSQWGGCSLLEVCSAPNSLRQNILESKYTKESHAST